MKIVITGRAIPYGRDGKRLAGARALRELDGIRYEKEACSDYFEFGDALDDAGVTGGTVALAYNSKRRRLEVTCTYEAARKLKAKERRLLVKATIGQLSDGIGEHCFDPVPKKKGITVDVCPSVKPEDFSIEEAGADVNADHPHAGTPLKMARGYGRGKAIVAALEARVGRE